MAALTATLEPDRPSARMLGRTVTVVCAALAGAAVVVYLLARPDLGPEALYLFVDASVAVVYGTVAGVVLQRRRHVVAYLLALAAVGGGMAAFGGAFRAFDAAGTPEIVGAWFSWAWVPGLFALFLVVPWLLRDRRLGPVAWCGVVAGTALTLAFTAQRLVWPMSDPRWLLAATVVLGLGTAVCVVVRAVRGSRQERVGLWWLAVGVTAMALSFVPLLVPYPNPIPFWLTPALHLVCQVLFSGAILGVILRQRLWGIDLRVSRALAASVLVVLLALAYVVSVLVVQEVFGDERLSQVVAAVVVVVAAAPLRTWAARRVRSLVYGDALDPHRAVTRVGAGFAADDQDLLATLVERLGTSFRLQGVTLSAGGKTVASYGQEGGTVPVVVPLVHRGRTLGELTATPRAGEWLGGRTVQALDDLADLLAAGLALTLALHDAEESRARLTQARLGERKVIRREIHDGLGPWLSGLRLGMQGARNALRTDPDLTESLLVSLLGELDQRIADVRALSHSLLPPAIEQLGLEPALLELVGRWERSGMAVRLRCSALPVLETPVAAAAYAIVSESLTNAAKHGRTDQADVEVGVDGDVLVVRCEDHGRGMPGAVVEGVGLRAMHERASELGGAVTVSSGRTGTCVHAVLPWGGR